MTSEPPRQDDSFLFGWRFLTCVCVCDAYRYQRPALACAQPADGAGSARTLATVAAVGWHSCLPSMWDAAASGGGGPIPGAASRHRGKLRQRCHCGEDKVVERCNARLDQPNPASRCCQAGVSVDALRALVVRLRTLHWCCNPARPTGRQQGLGHAERRRCTTLPLRRSGTCAVLRARHSGQVGTRAHQRNA